MLVVNIVSGLIKSLLTCSRLKKGVSEPIQPSIVPGCDGAGVVIAAGSSVQEFQPGDRVITYAAPELASSSGDDAPASLADAHTMLGHGVNGTLRSFGVFAEKALVHAPLSLDWLPAATIGCTWTTAWNALFGLEGKKAQPGKWILVQGTGGVSVATLQLAVAAGATVVATTSTEDREKRLKALGAAHTINYRSYADNWGEKARSLTPGGRGFDIVVDIGGNQTLPQALVSVCVDGVIVVAGHVGEVKAPVPLFATFMHSCIVRGLLCGSRAQLKQVIHYINKSGIQPAVDDIVFELSEAKDAYRRLNEKKHFSKVILRVDYKDV